jgi:hypothetical protein
MVVCQERSKFVDVHPVTVDKCAVSMNFISILSQDGDSVTFTVAPITSRLKWWATDFVAMDNELVCLQEEAATYTAKCDHDMTAIDVFAQDDLSFKQVDGSQIMVPDACDAPRRAVELCQFRYLLRCTPSLCDTHVTIPRVRHAKELSFSI